MAVEWRRDGRRKRGVKDLMGILRESPAIVSRSPPLLRSSRERRTWRALVCMSCLDKAFLSTEKACALILSGIQLLATFSTRHQTAIRTH
jgi:hypothetical protein